MLTSLFRFRSSTGQCVNEYVRLWNCEHLAQLIPTATQMSAQSRGKCLKSTASRFLYGIRITRLYGNATMSPMSSDMHQVHGIDIGLRGKLVMSTVPTDPGYSSISLLLLLLLRARDGSTLVNTKPSTAAVVSIYPLLSPLSLSLSLPSRDLCASLHTAPSDRLPDVHSITWWRETNSRSWQAMLCGVYRNGKSVRPMSDISICHIGEVCKNGNSYSCHW